MGEEVLDDRIELIFFEYRHGVTRVGYDPEIGLGNILCNEDCMQDGDGVVVAADDECGAADMVELVQGYMRLIVVEVYDLELVFDRWCLLHLA